MADMTGQSSMDDSPTAADSSTDTGAVDDSESADNSTQDEPVSVFLPKAAFGDKPPKVGDDLSDFKIVDIDPETGDAEARCSYDEKDSQMGESMSDSFDKAMADQ